MNLRSLRIIALLAGMAVVLDLVRPAAGQETATTSIATGAEANNQQGMIDAPSAALKKPPSSSEKVPQSLTAQAQEPSPAAQDQVPQNQVPQNQNEVPPDRASPSPEPSQPADQSANPAPVQTPQGAAAAQVQPTTGTAASKPAGAALAPPKQRRVRSFLIKFGAIAGAGVALGTVYALSTASPSKPPGSH